MTILDFLVGASVHLYYIAVTHHLLHPCRCNSLGACITICCRPCYIIISSRFIGLSGCLSCYPPFPGSLVFYSFKIYFITFPPVIFLPLPLDTTLLVRVPIASTIHMNSQYTDIPTIKYDTTFEFGNPSYYSIQ